MVGYPVWGKGLVPWLGWGGARPRARELKFGPCLGLPHHHHPARLRPDLVIANPPCTVPTVFFLLPSILSSEHDRPPSPLSLAPPVHRAVVVVPRLASPPLSRLEILGPSVAPPGSAPPLRPRPARPRKRRSDSKLNQSRMQYGGGYSPSPSPAPQSGPPARYNLLNKLQHQQTFQQAHHPVSWLLFEGVVGWRGWWAGPWLVVLLRIGPSASEGLRAARGLRRQPLPPPPGPPPSSWFN